MVSSIPSFAISLLFLATTDFLPLSVYAKGGFSVDLIHRDSPRSPLFDSSSTPSSRLKAAAERSLVRANYFRKSMQKDFPTDASSSSTSDNFYSEITSTSFEYFMSFYIGSPAKEVQAMLDTSSDLTWVQCKPCDYCFPDASPLFDPQASSTYKVISCEADSCSTVSNKSCGHESQCEYNYDYEYNTDYGLGSYHIFVAGFLSTETLSFNSTVGRRVQMPSTLFGCTYLITNGTFANNGSGLVGLGGGQLSLIRQLGSSIENKFSYCLPDVWWDHHPTTRLNFGSNAVVSGPSSITTPLIQGKPANFYFLHLEKISVDGQGSVPMKPSMQAAVNVPQGNIIIDSGTMFTFLDNETVQALANKVASSVSFPQVISPIYYLSHCFNVSGLGDDAKFPDITFHFSGNAPVVLSRDNAYSDFDDNVTCFALLSSDAVGINIFGNMAQRNFHIGYDLSAMQLTIAPADCANM